MDVDFLINDFAIRSFRDLADTDYISARMAFRAELATPCLWASQQTIEKYLKCILLLNRIPAKKVKHNLEAALQAVNKSGKLALDLSARTLKLIEHLDSCAQFRYLEVSNVAFGGDIIQLDRAVWELRRFCTLEDAPKQITLSSGKLAPSIRIVGGYLESVVGDRENPAREPLLWNNAYFRSRQRKYIKVKKWLKASNAPLYLNSQILDEVLKYVHLPGYLIEGYRTHKKP
jgi:hypothetical protein